MRPVEGTILENPYWSVEVVPQIGMGLANVSARLGEELKPILRPTDTLALEKVAELHRASGLSSFVLSPWSNRIRDAHFRFRGERHILLPNTPAGTAQHGDVRNRAFVVESSSAEHIEACFDGRGVVDLNFPVPFSLQVVYSLIGERFITKLKLRNLGDKPMPFGLGLHPYFVRRHAGVDAELTFVADGVYETDDSLMPTKAAVALPKALDFSEPRLIGDCALDHVFSGWNGRVVLSWPELRLELTADSTFGHLVLYTASDGSLAVEPVTHATDGFNLFDRGIPGTGVRVLDPGDEFSASFCISLRV